jgi:phenylalanyl-tRNA synthetase beta chain
MLFARDWLAEYVELPAADGPLAERLTFAGFNVDAVRQAPEEGGGGTVLDVDVTTNRPDCMNHLGLARELAVLFDRPLGTPPALRREAAPAAAAGGGRGRSGEGGAGGEGGEGGQEGGQEDPARLAGVVAVEVEDPADCPRYVARVVEGVRVGASPRWLVRRLASIGQRSVNNVVDVTNFVLWEAGQPLHAFDLDRLAGARVVVRRARPGERLVTLDGVPRELDPEVLVIADAERPVGLAGVMGGRDSEVTEGTTRVLIESGHFDRRRVRLTARRLGMHTDASHRFERGADLEACRIAADRAAELIAELAGGRVVAGAADCCAAPPPPRRGRLELGRLNAFAGAEMAAADVERWLAGLGFAPAAATAIASVPVPGTATASAAAPGTAAAAAPAPAAWEATVPSWRWFDFEPAPDGRVYEADLFEEVLRIHGLDRIPAALPALAGSDGPRTERQRVRERVRRFLAGVGFAEAINFAFEDPRAAAGLPTLRPGAAPLALRNPLSERQSAMRRSLLANLLDSARFNQRRGAAAVRLFEIGTAFFARAAGSEGGPLPVEEEHVAMVCGGTVGLPWDREVTLDLFDLKGAVEGLAGALGVCLLARPAALPGMAAGGAAELLDGGGAVVGVLGQIEQEEGFALFACELRLAALEGDGGASRPLELPSRFPGIDADLTLTHPASVRWRDLETAIAALRPPELAGFALKVRYQGEGVPAGAVNTTLAFSYNAQDRSLTQDEVNQRQLALAAELTRRFGWKD